MSYLTLNDRIESQQSEIERLLKDLEQTISERCKAADFSASQCASLVKSAEVERAAETATVAANTGNPAVSASPNRFEIEPRIQAQQEQIARLRGEIADLKKRR